ncbi:Rv1733c family protein [Mycolicibacterium komossense]|uniref:Transmembrane protein n=1 Tax=Mycolicibacterium komossense TaxID=1779 RepID=A0ABT3C993_9MYCO|nr:hypothetical protein [Mycolicibacterium komossense]MCV7226039.1 hypothetical protein [Mycolicibacterium komossense]
MFARAFGRNPLLRWTDRVEACLILFASLLALAAGPGCVAEGAAVYQSQAQLYAEQSLARHIVTASVVETDPMPHLSHTTTLPVLALWTVGDDGARGGERAVSRTAWINGDRTLKAGAHVDIWVDDSGVPVDPPMPAYQAGLDAIAAGAGLWGAVALGLVAAIAMLRSPIDQIRCAQLEREMEAFAGGGRSEGGTSRPPRGR